MTYSLAFYRGRRTALDRAIQAFTRSPFSHVELVLNTPDADGLDFLRSSSGRDGGVRDRRIAMNPDHWEIVRIEPWANADAWEIAGTQMGKPYDFRGIFLSQLLGASRHSRKGWFCSELCAHSLGLGEPHRLSPGALYLRVEEMNRAYYSGKSFS